jgi:hypothetical protein
MGGYVFFRLVAASADNYFGKRNALVAKYDLAEKDILMPTTQSELLKYHSDLIHEARRRLIYLTFNLTPAHVYLRYIYQMLATFAALWVALWLAFVKPR